VGVKYYADFCFVINTDLNKSYVREKNRCRKGCDAVLM
jgi:hypothetical protein